MDLSVQVRRTCDLDEISDMEELKVPPAVEGLEKIRPFIGCSHNKDYRRLGFILGYPYLGKLPYVDVCEKLQNSNGQQPKT